MPVIVGWFVGRTW